jgi:hemerythrin-like domain-containing protein
MREHRLIERMVDLMAGELHRIHDTGREVDSLFIYTAVDFFRTYADRTHHGKEEDILFRELANKSLAPEHRKIMGELIDEHALARRTVSGLHEATAAYNSGNVNAIRDVIKNLELLVSLYPRHIEKEDKHFFYPILDYFSKQEQDNMLKSFREFDQGMIHEKYLKVVEELGSREI